MRCIITGVETENKFRNIPVSTNAIKAAKKYQEIDPSLCLRKALMKLDKDFTAMIKRDIEEMEALKAESDAKISCLDQEKIRNGND